MLSLFSFFRVEDLSWFIIVGVGLVGLVGLVGVVGVGCRSRLCMSVGGGAWCSGVDVGGL